MKNTLKANQMTRNSDKESSKLVAVRAGDKPSHVRGERVLTFAKPDKAINSRLVSLLKPNSIEAERYRKLRYIVESMHKEGTGTVIGISSPLSGDGKTLTSLNLAGSLAQNQGSRVLIIELDVRKRGNNMRDYLGIKKMLGPGIVDKISDEEVKAEDITYYLQDFNLYVMPSGSITHSPYEVLNSPYLGELIKDARKNFDYIIVDTAPVALLPDSQLVSKWVDGFMIVVAAGKTPRKMLEETFNQMDPDKVLGLVFNGYTQISDSYYHGYY